MVEQRLITPLSPDTQGRKKRRADEEDSWGAPRNREVIGKRRYILRLCIVFLPVRKNFPFALNVSPRKSVLPGATHHEGVPRNTSISSAELGSIAPRLTRRYA